MRSLWNWSRLWSGKKGEEGGGRRKKKISQCVIKEWQLSQKKSWNFQKEHNPRPSLLHTPTRAVFVGCRDNNGSWRSRDRRLPTLTALRYVMNVWLRPPFSPPVPHLEPSSPHYTNMVPRTSRVLWTKASCGGQAHKNNTVCVADFCSLACSSPFAKAFDVGLTSPPVTFRAM